MIERTPRLAAGDSPAACLAAARALMRKARAAAKVGNRIAAGTFEAEACATGAYLLGRLPDSTFDTKAGYDGTVHREYRRARNAGLLETVEC